MTKTVYRQVTGMRRSPRPRSTGSSSGSFGGMLAKLGLASARLRKTRRKR